MAHEEGVNVETVISEMEVSDVDDYENKSYEEEEIVQVSSYRSDGRAKTFKPTVDRLSAREARRQKLTDKAKEKRQEKFQANRQKMNQELYYQHERSQREAKRISSRQKELELIKQKEEEEERRAEENRAAFEAYQEASQAKKEEERQLQEDEIKARENERFRAFFEQQRQDEERQRRLEELKQRDEKRKELLETAEFLAKLGDTASEMERDRKEGEEVLKAASQGNSDGARLSSDFLSINPDAHEIDNLKVGISESLSGYETPQQSPTKSMREDLNKMSQDEAAEMSVGIHGQMQQDEEWNELDDIESVDGFESNDIQN